MSSSEGFDETVSRLCSHRTLGLIQFVDALDDLAASTPSDSSHVNSMRRSVSRVPSATTGDVRLD
jgi:hypothetical protein